MRLDTGKMRLVRLRGRRDRCYTYAGTEVTWELARPELRGNRILGESNCADKGTVTTHSTKDNGTYLEKPRTESARG